MEFNIPRIHETGSNYRDLLVRIFISAIDNRAGPGCAEEFVMRRGLAIIILVLMMGLTVAQPIFESSGSVRGHGIGHVQQFNPYNAAANYNYYGG